MYYLIPIGVVHTSVSDEVVRNSIYGVPGVIEVFQEFANGLRGIDGFSHIIVISYLHRTTEESRKVLTVKPRKLVKLGLSLNEIPEVGVFSTDSPHRPNPIGITIVRLLKREDRYLYVEGLDLFNNTPVMDLRPYTPERIIADLKVPEWYSTLLDRVRRRLGGSNEALRVGI